MCGIEVYDDSSHVKKDIGVDNCCSSATNICNGAGIPVANPLVPSFFTKELQKHGFQTIDKEEFKSKFGIKKIIELAINLFAIQATKAKMASNIS